MDAWFTIELSPRIDLLRIAMGGFYQPADVARFQQALADAIVRLGCAPNQQVTLCDITAMNIQSQEMVGHFATMIARPETRSRRLAFVTGATLARLQARRLTDREGVMFFSDHAAALAWLRADRAEAA